MLNSSNNKLEHFLQNDKIFKQYYSKCFYCFEFELTKNQQL